jgi:hypothetical protein
MGYRVASAFLSYRRRTTIFFSLLLSTSIRRSKQTATRVLKKKDQQNAYTFPNRIVVAQ